MNEFVTTWTEDIFRSSNPQNILVNFKDGREAVFTKAILSELMQDKNVKYIFDCETGELIHEGRLYHE